MSDTTAAQQLAELEARILDGENVDPAELAAARAAVDVAQLADTGRRRRAEAKAAAAAAQAIADAKAHAIAVRRDSADLTEAGAAFAQAKAAIARMAEHLGRYNTARDEAIQRLVDAQVPAGDRTTSPRAWPADVDRANHVLVDYGNQIAGVVVDGSAWGPETVRAWLAILLAQLNHPGVGIPDGPAREFWPAVLVELEEAK